MKLLIRGDGGGGARGGGERGDLGGETGREIEGRGEKNPFSFKKCSPFQFVKRKVRRWMRNPKVSSEGKDVQGKACMLYPCTPKCPLVADDLWYTQVPLPYSCCCCHYDNLPGGQNQEQNQEHHRVSGREEKSKAYKVRKWKMLNRHHHDAKQKEAGPEVHFGGSPCRMRASQLRPNPVMMECCICSGPLVTYNLEEAWQPRQRAQAMDLYYHSDLDQEGYCCSDDSSKNTNYILTTLNTYPNYISHLPQLHLNYTLHLH
ncbi:hypothetical protein UPYG_G00247960 [Umbra pygmaea]|uniref:Uncharacterized protein n=1 Tax=Umbra pygmaea TaxID=75934 RepID=A0ABD0WBQ2_UMBPY